MLDLRNEFVFPPIKLGYSEDGTVNERHIDFYSIRSSHVGAVTLEPLYLRKDLREIPTQLGIDDDDRVRGLSELVESIHAGGAKVIAHLNHPGRMANPKIPGNSFVSSTDRACENGGAVPRRMQGADFEEVISLFTQAAVRAERAGFDIIELQFGHGYLLAQFLSPAVNDRTDEFGGSFENRVRFPLALLEAVKNETSLAVIARISGEDFVPNGITLSEMMEFSRMLKERGVSAIHVTAGSVCVTPPWFFQHMFIPKGKTWEMASKIKESVDIPVIFVGRINSFDDIDRVERDYSADYVAVGRALVADPDFLGKYLGEVEGNVRPCLACSDGCLGGVKVGKGLGCVVNPTVGRDGVVVGKAEHAKRYAVVGGGLAGMEASVTLARRGHEVVLYEREKLGGQFNLASLPPGKESLSRLVDYFVDEIREESVEVVNEEATPETLLNGGFDGVVLATGALPAVPPIEGLGEYYWAEVLKDENIFENKKTVVIGGGLIGVEVAHRLLEKGNEVVIVEMLEDIARGMEMIEKAMTLKKFKEKGVEVHLNSRVEKIDGDRVIISRGDERVVIDGVERIVVATGMRSYNPLEEEIKDKISTFVVGDAKQVGKAQDAIRSAFDTVVNL